jgi:hypothetical protein
VKHSAREYENARAEIEAAAEKKGMAYAEYAPSDEFAPKHTIIQLPA